MKFIAKVLPLLIVVGLVMVHPLVSLGAAAAYAWYVWLNMGKEAHVSGAAKQLGSDAGWLYQSSAENVEDGMRWAAKVNAEGKLAFANSDGEYAKGFVLTCAEVEADYAKTRGEWRTKTETATKTAEEAIASLAN